MFQASAPYQSIIFFIFIFYITRHNADVLVLDIIIYLPDIYYGRGQCQVEEEYVTNNKMCLDQTQTDTLRWSSQTLVVWRELRPLEIRDWRCREVVEIELEQRL